VLGPKTATQVPSTTSCTGPSTGPCTFGFGARTTTAYTNTLAENESPGSNNAFVDTSVSSWGASGELDRIKVTVSAPTLAATLTAEANGKVPCLIPAARVPALTNFTSLATRGPVMSRDNAPGAGCVCPVTAPPPRKAEQ